MEFLAVVWFLSAIPVLVLTVTQSVLRSKSAFRWMKGFSLKKKCSKEEVYQILQGLSHPLFQSVTYDNDGNIVVNTQLYNFKIQLSEDKEGNTVVIFLVN